MGNIDAKVLSACLAMVKLELKKFNTHLESELQSIKSETSRKALKEEIVSAAVSSFEVPIQELPTGLVYEVHLEDVKYDLTEQIAGVNASISVLASEFEKKHSVLDYNILSDKNNFSEFVNSDFTELQSSVVSFKEEYDKEKSNIISSIDFLNEESKNQFTNLSESLNAATKSLYEKIDSVLASLNEYQVTESDITKAELEKIKTSVAESTKSLTEDFSSSIASVYAFHKAYENIVSADLLSIKSSIESAVKSANDQYFDVLTALKNHTHDTKYSEKDHVHTEYASRKNLIDVEQKVETTNTKIGLVDVIISKIQKELSNKLSVGQALTKDDLQQLSVQITKEVQNKVKVPENGKDGLNWEFRFDPQRRGMLMYKREDQKQWKYQNLVGPTQQISGGGYFGGGAVGTAQQFLTELKDVNFDQNNPPDDGNVLVYDASSGKFNFISQQSVNTGITQITIPLSGKTFNLNYATYNIAVLISHKVINTNNVEVSVVTKQLNASLILESNVDLNGYNLIITCINNQ